MKMMWMILSPALLNVLRNIKIRRKKNYTQDYAEKIVTVTQWFYSLTQVFQIAIYMPSKIESRSELATMVQDCPMV